MLAEMSRLNHFQLATIYNKNRDNISKLDNDIKCVLSYRESVFALKQHKPLLNSLDRSFESYFTINNIDKDTLLGFYVSSKITPNELFKKNHQPPPFEKSK